MTDYTAAVVSAGNHEVPDKWKEVEEEVEDRKARYALECLSLWIFNWLLLLGYCFDDIRHPSPRLSGFNFANLTFQLAKIVGKTYLILPVGTSYLLNKIQNHPYAIP